MSLNCLCPLHHCPMTHEVTSSYGPDWTDSMSNPTHFTDAEMHRFLKNYFQDRQFILSDIAYEKEQAMRETNPEDWQGVEE